MNDTNKTQFAPPYSWFDAVQMLIQAPTAETMQRILNDKTLTPQRAYLWVCISGVFLGVALAGVYRPNELINAMVLGLPGLNVEGSEYEPSLMTIVLLGLTMGSMYGLIGFIVQTWLLQRVGEFFNSKSNYRDVFVLRGIYYPLILVVRGVVVALLGYNSIATNILIFGTIMVDFILAAVAMSAANKLSWREGLMIVAGMNAGLFIGLIVLGVLGLLVG